MVRQGWLAIAGGFAVLVSSAALAQDFSARLGRVPVDSRTQSTVAGIGHVRADLSGDRLRIEGEFSGLLGAATGAKLHIGAAVGVRGSVIHELSVDGEREGEIRGNVRLSDDELAALRAGRLYIQIQSEAAPDGNLWGWLFVE